MKIEDQLIVIMDGECNIDAEVDQSIYPRPDWAVDQIVRASGLVENICRHGVGHPHPASVTEFEEIGITHMGTHGCDGCCCIGMKKEIKRAYEKKFGDD